MTELITVIVISIIAMGIAVFWRTCIYTRGAIFRPIGRILDYWALKGCLPKATFFDKVLRFIAYPLGRCIYCSGFHISYDVFFVLRYGLNLQLSLWWLLPLFAFNHLFIIMFMNKFITGNVDMERGDWDYMSTSKNKFFDLPGEHFIDEEQVKLNCEKTIPKG